MQHDPQTNVSERRQEPVGKESGSRPKQPYQSASFPPSLKEARRFWSKVNIGPLDQCWEWTGYRSNLYGQFTISDKAHRAHRIAMQDFLKSPISKSLNVCHACDNPPCCNPAHLFVATWAENMRDMFTKGRNWSPRMPGEAHPAAKLKEWQVLEIRRLYKLGVRPRFIRKEFPISKGCLEKILAGKTWTHLLEPKP